MKDSIKRGYIRMAIFPFEMTFAGLAIVSGIVGLMGDPNRSADSLTTLFPDWLVILLNIFYVMSGLAIAIGLTAPRRDFEAFGIVQLAAAVVIRTVAVAIVAGFGAATATTYIFYAILLWACGARLVTLFTARNGTNGAP